MQDEDEQLVATVLRIIIDDVERVEIQWKGEKCVSLVIYRDIFFQDFHCIRDIVILRNYNIFVELVVQVER